jgi:prepilin-type N-terminal cleavage/methylation domain-containing protein
MQIRLRRATRNAGGRAGFSLIELSIAILLMVFGVLSAFYSQITAANLLRSLREHNAAVADLETCMERIMLLPIDVIPRPTGLYASGAPIAAFTNLHLPGEQIVATYPNMVAATVPDPLEIRLTATWNDWRGRQQSLPLTTMKTR